MALKQLGIDANKLFFMIIAGKSGSGKSHFLRFLIKEINIHQPFDYGIVISNTYFEKESFDYIPKKYIFE
jgi:ABC-type ATPase involved in cell division